MFNDTYIRDFALASEIYEDVILKDYSSSYKPKRRTKKSIHYISMMLLGTNGLYAILDGLTNENDILDIYQNIKTTYKLNDNQIFLFSAGTYPTFYDYEQEALIPIEEDLFEVKIENCYFNHLIPDVDAREIDFENNLAYLEEITYESTLSDEDFDSAYITPVIPFSKVKQIIEMLEESKYNAIEDGEYLIYPDGKMEVRKTVSKKVGIFSTFVEDREATFPCMENDGDSFFRLTFFGGLFGLHKFATGNYMKGLFYLLSCGCCGVFYVSDLFAILCGNYSYYHCCDFNNSVGRQRIFSRPVKNKMMAFVMLLLSIVISYIVVRFAYLPLLENVTAFLSEALSSTSFGQGLAESFIH